MGFVAKGKNKEKKYSIQIQDKRTPHTVLRKFPQAGAHHSTKENQNLYKHIQLYAQKAL